MPNPGRRATPLTDEEIIDMRNARAAGGTLKFLSWLFETTQANAHLIVTGQTHKNVGGPITKVKDPTTEADVIEIRTMRALGYSYRELEEEFNRTGVALRSICSGKSFPQFGGPLTGRNK